MSKGLVVASVTALCLFALDHWKRRRVDVLRQQLTHGDAQLAGHSDRDVAELAWTKEWYDRVADVEMKRAAKRVRHMTIAQLFVGAVGLLAYFAL